MQGGGGLGGDAQIKGHTSTGGPFRGEKVSMFRILLDVAEVTAGGGGKNGADQKRR